MQNFLNPQNQCRVSYLSEGEENFNESDECCGVVPHDEDLKPLATKDEAVEQVARMAQEVEVQHEY